jgi:hypothetical protein
VTGFSCIFQRFSWLQNPDVKKRAYELFVEDIEVITDNSKLCDVITVDEEQSVLLELNVRKGSGPDGIQPLIVNNCASVHPLLRVHFFFFLRDLYRHVFFPTSGNFPT